MKSNIRNFNKLNENYKMASDSPSKYMLKIPIPSIIKGMLEKYVHFRFSSVQSTNRFQMNNKGKYT